MSGITINLNAHESQKQGFNVICVYIYNNGNLHLSDYRVNSRITVFGKKNLE